VAVQLRNDILFGKSLHVLLKNLKGYPFLGHTVAKVAVNATPHPFH